jgi:serine/threonine protein phosphatase PrpC
MLRVVEHFEKSDTGRQRRANEDRFYARAPLFVVADGMGGAQAGEVASRLATEAFADGLPPDGSAEERLAGRVRAANRRIHERSRADEGLAGMGTTLTAAYADGDEVALAHVGDSRAYLLRGEELTRLTRDHSLVDELVRRGKLTEEEAAGHPQRSIITRALGPEADVEIDTSTHRLRDGDVLLLCSDGLTSMLAETEVAEILREAESLDAAGHALVAAANEAGGRDNITVVLARFAEAGARDPRTASARTAVAPRAAERRSERERRAHGPLPRRVKLFAATAATLIALGAVVVAGWLASRAVFFVGTDERGMVAVYRGLPWELPAGLRLYESYYVSGVPASEVPPARRERLLDHQLRSRDDVQELMTQLELGKLSP